MSSSYPLDPRDSATEALKVPPHSIEAEQSLLGGLMLDNAGWDQIADRVSEEDFYRRDHRLIFRAIASLAEKGSPVDVITLSEWLEQSQNLEDAGGLAYLGALAKNTPSAANIRAYADIVRERSILRQLIQVGTQIANSAFQPEGRDSKALLDEAERRVFEIAEQTLRSRRGFRSIKELLVKAVDRIDTLFQQDSPITGVPCGFADLDELTAGLQRSDLVIIAGRPSMGKCVVSGSLILDPESGRLRTIDDMVRERRGHLVTMQDDYKLWVAAPCDFLDDGRKPVFRVRTALGREIATTLPHPFLTVSGWKPLGILKPGDRIAVPRVLPYFGNAQLSDERVKLIAYVLTDGGLTHAVPHFTNTDPRLRNDFIDCLKDFPGVKARIQDSRGTRTPTVRVSGDLGFIRRGREMFGQRLRQRMAQLSLTGRALAVQLQAPASAVHYWTAGAAMPASATLGQLCKVLDTMPVELAPSGVAALRKNGRNAVTEWLDAIGLWGKSAHEKCVPEIVFELPRPELALFLNRLFACDGSVYVQNQDQAAICYCTVNRDLARQVQHLLLRFGVIAKLRERHTTYRGERRPFFELRITGQDDVRRFLEEIGAFGKEQAVERALKVSRRKGRKVNHDTLPQELWEFIAQAKGTLRWSDVYRRLGKAPHYNFHVGRRGLSRARVAEIASALEDEGLSRLAESDLYWDRIETIEYLGERQVYDLSVADTHNFVAEDVLVHNTTLAMNIAEHAAIKDKVPVAIFSMEMPGEQLAMRLMSSLGRIDQHKVRTGKLDDDDWPRLTSAVSILAEAPMFVDDTPQLTPSDLRARCRRLVREHGLGLVVIDYLQLMQVPDTKENRATEISEISRALKALAKEMDVPVIALSQLNRSLEQRPDKRPRMADLRECVTGDTLVCLADGRRRPVRDLVGEQPELWAVDDSHRLVRAQADKVWSVGVKPIYKVQLASGRGLRATGSHRILTGSGWREVREMGPGERIALARYAPAPEAPAVWSDEEIILLGHLVGDGSYLVHQPLRYTTASEENSGAVRQAAEALGSTVTRHTGRGHWHQLVIAGNGDRWHPRGVGRWLKALGIFGERSHEKRLPEAVFGLANPQLALLLRHLWATDGCISTRRAGARGAPRVYFSTASEHLARDVAALLLRFGIVGRIRKAVPAKGRPVFSVDVNGVDQQLRFLDQIGAFGPRLAPAQALRAALAGIRCNTNVDTLPREVFADVRARMAEMGVSQRGMAALRGTSYGGTSHFRFAPSRGLLMDYARCLKSNALLRWADSDLFWDRVVEIRPDGEQEVFDLTVPGPASWLADGVVSHNSGAIEQDADVIVFIYRDEVYNPESPDKGTAEIIIAKQRNGPTGMTRLTFLGQYTRFENYTRDGFND